MSMNRLVRHCAVAFALFLQPVAAFAQASPPAGAAALSPADATKVDQRARMLHDQLGITSAQQPQWDQFASVMRDNAAAMGRAASDRGARLASMDASETMKSYAALTQVHAANMERLADAFTTLYATLSLQQKQKADTVFRARAESRAAARTPG